MKLLFNVFKGKTIKNFTICQFKKTCAVLNLQTDNLSKRPLGDSWGESFQLVEKIQTIYFLL